MFCVACMVVAHGVVVQFAIALLLISRKTKWKKWKDMCVCNGVCSFDEGLYMLCVACMILAYVFAVQIAIALLLLSRSKKMQESIRTCVFERGVICRIWIVYGLYMFCGACMILAVVLGVNFAIALLLILRRCKNI